MACRCRDIKLYDADITALEEAATHAQKIIDKQISIDDSIDTLKISYTKSAKGPDGFGAAFDDIHDGAIENARMIKSQIDGAILTVKANRASAQAEDDSWAFEHEF